MNNLRGYLSGKNLYTIFLHLLVIVPAIEVVVVMRQHKELKKGRGSTAHERSRTIQTSSEELDCVEASE
jgi:hypothetical protein